MDRRSSRILSKLVLGLSLCLAPLALTDTATAAVGGPDGFGYTWQDSAEPGVFFSWIDISLTGTDLLLTADDRNSGFMPLSFPMPYYGSSYMQLAICTNGWVSFVDDTSTSFGNRDFPGVGAPTGIIGAYWDDLTLTTQGQVMFQDFGTHAVISWLRVPRLSSITDLASFQIVLYADGLIAYNYLSLEGTTTLNSAGIESPDELYGLTVWDDPPAGVTTPLTVEFYPPEPVSIDIDCSAVPLIACGDSVDGDLASGLANQADYLCAFNSYAGREQVYQLDLATPTTVRLVLETLSGNPDFIVINDCDPNNCVSPPTDELTLTDAVGTFYIVVDSAAGEEGEYRLRVDCLPIPATADCAGAPVVECGDTVSGDLAMGSAANQDIYWCTAQNFSGAEDVYRIDLVSTADLLVDMTVFSGNPQLLVIDACDPNVCLAGPADSINLTDIMGTYYIIVDSAPGDEGSYELTFSCLSDQFSFCQGDPNGGLALETDRYGNGDGAWLVEGWLYHPGDTHTHALRIDGAQTYTHDTACTQFPDVTAGSLGLTGPAFVEWGAPEGTVELVMSETNYNGCCGLLIEIEVTNTDVVPHSYEYRSYLDTAFGTGDGTGLCGIGTVDGGHMELDGTMYTTEQDLLALGADTCERQLQTFSADDPSQVAASYQVLPPNTPTTMEWLDWNDGGVPCTTWDGLVDGEALDGCGGDNSVLMIWRFPAGAGELAPGESATASYRIGNGCVFPCEDCDTFPPDVTPPDEDVGSALRATGHTDDTVDFDWSLTAPLLANEHYEILRSDNNPEGPFDEVADHGTELWTDPDAPASFGPPSHVWYYDVRRADECDNRTDN